MGCLTVDCVTAPPTGDGSQYSFDDLEPALATVTFVVVDLETTGGSAERDAITEIGAVKVRGGEVIGEFATLVDPRQPIPPQIVMLTSITDAMVRDAPTIEAVLPAFLEFCRGSVLVAHNARFDIGFLKAAAARVGTGWPAHQVVDTVRLARAVLPRSEVPSVRLGVLAALFGARTSPNHRALADARATVDVLHALLERLGPLGVTTVPDLLSAHRAVDPARRRKRHLADHLPAAPGVYLFRAADDEVLYIGTSTNLRTRVRSYFTAAETRGSMATMVQLAARVDHVVCATALEAHIREQRLIAAHRPRYNRRSKNPERAYYLELSGAGPRRIRSVAAAKVGAGPRLGPFTSQRLARQIADLLTSAAALTPPDGAGAEELAALWAGESDLLLGALRERMARLAEAGIYDAAAHRRDELATLVDALDRGQRFGSFCRLGEIITANPDGAGGWELAVIRRGRLVSAGCAVRGADPMRIVDMLADTAETLPDGAAARPSAASAEESLTLLSFVERPEVRLVRVSEPWASPARAAGRWRPFLMAVAAARDGQRYDQP